MNPYQPTERQIALTIVRMIAAIQAEHTNHVRRETQIRAIVRVIRRRNERVGVSPELATTLLACDWLLGDIIIQDITHKEVKILLETPLQIAAAFAEKSGASADDTTDDDKIPF